MLQFPPELQTFAAILPTPLYAVGGCVRDALLGKEQHDVDLCSALAPDVFRAYAEQRHLPCPIVNERLGTVLLHVGGRMYEHTTFRTESYAAGGAHRPDAVAFTDSLEADAFRRDFSVNALYENVLTGELLDPTGGLKDLERRILRTTTPDPYAILRDDGLRILRLVRFAATLGFAVDPATWDCAKANAHLLSDVAWERKRQELDRMFLLPDPLPALTLLHTLGALFELIPELAQGDGLLQRADYHRYDVLTHSLHTCAEMPAQVPLRLMGLLHDVGKPQSLAETGNFHRHAVYGETLTRTVLRRLKYPNAIVSRVARAVRNHMFDLDGRAKEPTIRLTFASLGKEGANDLILLREADIRGSGIRMDYTADRWRRVYGDMLRDGCPWSMDELAVTGRDLMAELHLSPSPALAEGKERLWRHCVCHPQDNTKARLLRLAHDCIPLAELVGTWPKA